MWRLSKQGLETLGFRPPAGEERDLSTDPADTLHNNVLEFFAVIVDV
jgi:hypothetical protein